MYLRQQNNKVYFFLHVDQFPTISNSTLQLTQTQKNMDTQLRCSLHNIIIEKVCFSKHCNNRLVCPSCSHHHQQPSTVSYMDLKYSVKKMQKDFDAYLNQRLCSLIDFLKKKFTIYLQDVEAKIVQRKTYFLKDHYLPLSCLQSSEDYSVYDYLEQIEEDRYDDLDDNMLTLVLTVVENYKKMYKNISVELSENDRTKMDRLTKDAFPKIALIENIFFDVEEYRVCSTISTVSEPETKQSPGFFSKIFGAKDITAKQSSKIESQLVGPLGGNIQQFEKQFKDEQLQMDKVLKKIHIIIDQNSMISSKLVNMKLSSDRLFTIMNGVGYSKWSRVRILDLGKCEIRSLNCFGALSSMSVEKLGLQDNQISSIRPLCRLAIPNLLQLRLDSNRIYSLKPLEQGQVHELWPNLKGLDLSNNRFTSIACFQHLQFKKLQSLALNQNKIISLDPFKQVMWPSITHIHLSKSLVFRMSIFDIIEKVQVIAHESNSRRPEDFKDPSLTRKFYTFL